MSVLLPRLLSLRLFENYISPLLVAQPVVVLLFFFLSSLACPPVLLCSGIALFSAKPASTGFLVSSLHDTTPLLHHGQLTRPWRCQLPWKC